MNARELALEKIGLVVARRPRAVDLARLASLAVRIEAPLLRRLRLELLPEADVGAEADLWFSALIESRGPTSIVLHPEVAAQLREELGADPALERAIEILREAHANEPPTIRLEEEVNALAVARGRDALPDIDAALRRAILTLRESEERGLEIARWILRASPRLHPLVHECPSTITLVLAASTMLGRRAPGPVARTAASLAELGWVLPADALRERVTIGVERVPDGLRFTEPDGVASVLEAPRTDPRLVEVSWHEGSTARRVVVEAEPGTFVELGPDADDVRILTLAGDAYVFERAEQEMPVQDAVGAPDGEAMPDWLRAGMVVIQPLVQEDPFGFGLIGPEGVVMMSSGPFREERLVRARGEGWQGRARVLNPGSESLLLLWPLFELNAAPQPLLEPGFIPDLGPEPVEAEAWTLGPEGPRVLRIPDAVSAGLEQAYGGEMREFEIVLESNELGTGLAGGVLVWGERVAGLINGVRQEGSRWRASVIAAAHLRQSSEATRGELRRVGNPRVIVGSVSSGLGEVREYVVDQLRRLGLDPMRTHMAGLGEGAPFLDVERPMGPALDIMQSDALIVIAGVEPGPQLPGENSVAEREYDLALASGVDVIVCLERFMGGGSPAPGTYEASWWRFRDRLESERVVLWFEYDFRSLDLAREVMEWRAGPVRIPERQRRPSLIKWPRLARAVIVAPPNATDLAARIGETRHDERRATWWTERKDGPPGELSGVMLFTSRTEPDWPIALDFDNTAVAVIAVPAVFDAERRAAASLAVVRTARKDLPVVFAVTAPRTESEELRVTDPEQLQALLGALDSLARKDAREHGLRTNVEARHAFALDAFIGRSAASQTVQAVSSRPGAFDDVVAERDALRSAIVERIGWENQLALDSGPTSVDATVRDVLATGPASAFRVLRQGANRRPGSNPRVAALAGERALDSVALIVRDPKLFEDIVLAMIERAKRSSNGLPAVLLSSIAAEFKPPILKGEIQSEVEVDRLVRGIADELERYGLALCIDDVTEPLVAFPWLLERSPEPPRPPETMPVLRATWTARGNTVFIRLLAHFAFRWHGGLAASWNPETSTGRAVIQVRPPLWLEMTIWGEGAELTAFVEASPRQPDVREIVDRLRDTLSTVLPNDPTLSIEAMPAGPARA